MARRSPPRKVTYFEPVAPRLARNTVIESTFEVGRRYRCTMRIDCGRLDPGIVIRADLGEWHPCTPGRLDEEELADWRAGRDAIYQLAALTIGSRLAVADGKVSANESPGREDRSFGAERRGAPSIPSQRPAPCRVTSPGACASAGCGGDRRGTGRRSSFASLLVGPLCEPRGCSWFNPVRFA